MSLFTTRVELHKAVSADYEQLHAEMEKEGFYRTISLSGENTVYYLPTAEYNYSSTELGTEAVMNLAKKAAARTGKTYSILTTKADGRRYWHNLEIKR